VSSRKESAIALNAVAVRYPSCVALDGISLELQCGEILAILRPNGAGKSTLLRVMTGVLAPSSGEVRLFGHSVPSMDRREVARQIAFVAQTTDVALGFTVREVVTMGRAPHQGGWMTASEADHALVASAMSRCELATLADRRVETLSGGERKRVAIARALAQEPKVLLLDEPGAFLDVRHQLVLYEMLEHFAAEGMAVALSMHDINAAAQYASRILLLKEGSVVADGVIEQVLTYRRLRETFDADLYCGTNDVTGARFFLPMRTPVKAPS
jgi:iron complex transport system ATP-binding protein